MAPRIRCIQSEYLRMSYRSRGYSLCQEFWISWQYQAPLPGTFGAPLWVTGESRSLAFIRCRAQSRKRSAKHLLYLRECEMRAQDCAQACAVVPHSRAEVCGGRNARLTNRVHGYQNKAQKKPIGDHALPQRAFGFSTPSGAEREGATGAGLDIPIGFPPKSE
jgi:hypothetical protein